MKKNIRWRLRDMMWYQVYQLSVSFWIYIRACNLQTWKKRHWKDRDKKGGKKEERREVRKNEWGKEGEEVGGKRRTLVQGRSRERAWHRISWRNTAQQIGDTISDQFLGCVENVQLIVGRCDASCNGVRLHEKHLQNRREENSKVVRRKLRP